MTSVQQFATELVTGTALQQPTWDDPQDLALVTARLQAAEPLVSPTDVARLREQLASAAAGEVNVIQAGDCAEDWSETTPGHVARKQELLDAIADTMERETGRPVLRVGRIAGQYAKPRSTDVETVAGVELPVFRGHMVNSPNPDAKLRTPDPWRMLTGYRAAYDTTRLLGWGTDAGRTSATWTSHEMLLLDYELAMVRQHPDGGHLLTSTHWPWIGDRTRQVAGAHVDLLSALTNPVACKVGPTMATGELLALCERLDPRREPGRLTLISRMGAEAVLERLPVLVSAVRAAGHPVVWLCDPMHGNTVRRTDGSKTRLVETVVREVQRFQNAVDSGNGVPGGLHLETTPEDVTECVDDEHHLDQPWTTYTSFCDPRLNPRQALTVAAAWRS